MSIVFGAGGSATGVRDAGWHVLDERGNTVIWQHKTAIIPMVRLHPLAPRWSLMACRIGRSQRRAK
jgi:hypothetical protein